MCLNLFIIFSHGVFIRLCSMAAFLMLMMPSKQIVLIYDTEISADITMLGH